MSIDRKSGLYARTIQGFEFELRLDVDGDQPQNQVSLSLLNRYPSHWIALVSEQDSGIWMGDIWYRHNKADSLKVNGEVPNSFSVEWIQEEQDEFVMLSFISNGDTLFDLRIDRRSDFFRSAEFELDHEENIPFLLEYNTHEHPHRPSDLPGEDLSLTSIYERAGVQISFTEGGNDFTNVLAGLDAAWNESELHDAMQAQWSRPDGTPWSMWILSAGYYENEPGYVTFGIMFDSIGRTHRNGTAVFNQSIEDFYPLSTANREATIRRHKFRTLIHEIGHAFNFAHSWQKELGKNWHSSVVNEPDAMSFMNYPRKVTGGADAYWNGFRFAFSDQELLFLRHAPADFVSMGGSSWFENHADAAREVDLAEVMSRSRDSLTKATAPFALELRFNRTKPIFDFLEPVRMELKLTNTSDKDQEVSRDIVEDPAAMDIFITNNQGETSRHFPYFRTCHETDMIVLKPGEAVYGSILLSSATNGWIIAEPGRYDVVVSLRPSCNCDGGVGRIFVDATTSLYVRNPNPRSRREEERLAQDMFADDVGRILAMGGSKILESGNDVLRELSDRFPTHAVTSHANVALALPEIREYKLVEIDRDGRLKLSRKAVNLEQAQKKLQRVLIDDGRHNASSLGHINFKRITDKLCRSLENAKDKGMAATFQQNILEVMNQRRVTMPGSVIKSIQQKIEDLRKK